MRKPSSRALLIAAIVVLLGVLFALVVLFVRVSEPPSIERPEGDALEWVRSIYGFGPTADEQFDSVYSVAIGPDGDIYATDTSRSRVLVFSRFGEYERIVHTAGGGTGPGQFLRPAAIEVDRLGRLYVADAATSKILVFDEDGELLREWAVPTQARGVAVDGGEVFVLGAGTVYVYDLEGRELRQFGTRGKEEGQIDAYQGIVVRDGRVYIADAYNKRIQAFDTNGTFAWANDEYALPDSSVGTTPTAETSETAGWQLPQDLTFDGAGRLVVVDAFQFNLTTVDPSDGTVLATYGDFGTADGDFFYPSSVAYDPARDWFAVADTRNQRVQIVRLPGSTQAGVLAAFRRAEASPERFLAIPAALLLLLLVFAVDRWIRWGRNAQVVVEEGSVGEQS